MKVVRPALIAAVCAGLLSACASDADPWLARGSFSAAATPGAAALLRAHSSYTPDCEIGEPPMLVIEQQGALGVATIADTTEAIRLDGADCDGDAAPAAGVFYEAGVGALGYDTVVYRELRAPAAPDVQHTAVVRVR
jgi:hypothetical protein